MIPVLVLFKPTAIAQDIVFTNETSCDFEVKVTYGDITSCTTVYYGYCAATTGWMYCDMCPDGCDCSIPGSYSCGPTSYSLTYSVPASSQVNLTPPATVCCFHILDTNTPQNVVHQCCCDQQECGCYTQINCGPDVGIDITPGWSIKWTEI